jgi:hypothetical protein
MRRVQVLGTLAAALAATVAACGPPTATGDPEYFPVRPGGGSGAADPGAAPFVGAFRLELTCVTEGRANTQRRTLVQTGSERASVEITDESADRRFASAELSLGEIDRLRALVADRRFANLVGEAPEAQVSSPGLRRCAIGVVQAGGETTFHWSVSDPFSQAGRTTLAKIMSEIHRLEAFALEP